MEAIATALTLSLEQKNAIIEEIVKNLEEIIKDPTSMTGEPYDEDDYGNSYGKGKESFSGDVEDFEISELPGFSEDADIYIAGKFNGSYSWYDDYEPGDYWTPESGGLEIDDCEVHLVNLKLELGEWGEEAQEMIYFEIHEDTINEIMNEINKRVA